jgi:hypothetical protein
MTRNVDTVDRVLRIVIGLALLALPLVLESDARWLGLIGLVPLLTGIAGSCPAYRLFGIRTCPLANQRA